MGDHQFRIAGGIIFSNFTIIRNLRPIYQDINLVLNLKRKQIYGISLHINLIFLPRIFILASSQMLPISTQNFIKIL